MLCEAKDQKLCFWRVKMTDFLSVDLSVALNIHLCHADCHACYIKNTFCVRQVQHLFLWPSLERPFIITTFSVVFLFFLFSLVVVFFSLDKVLLTVPEKCTGSKGLRRFAPCEGCSQGVVLGRNWFNRSPYYISKRQQISSVPEVQEASVIVWQPFVCQVALRGLVVPASKCHEDYGFNTAKRSFIHVFLLIALFSILVFGCLETDDRSCRRLRHCLLVNSPEYP